MNILVDDNKEDELFDLGIFLSVTVMKGEAIRDWQKHRRVDTWSESEKETNGVFQLFPHR